MRCDALHCAALSCEESVGGAAAQASEMSRLVQGGSDMSGPVCLYLWRHHV